MILGIHRVIIYFLLVTFFKTLLLRWLLLKIDAFDLSHFADFEQVKIFSSHFADFEQVKFLTSYFTDFEQVKIGYGHSTDFEQ